MRVFSRFEQNALSVLWKGLLRGRHAATHSYEMRQKIIEGGRHGTCFLPNAVVFGMTPEKACHVGCTRMATTNDECHAVARVQAGAARAGGMKTFDLGTHSTPIVCEYQAQWSCCKVHRSRNVECLQKCSSSSSCSSSSCCTCAGSDETYMHMHTRGRYRWRVIGWWLTFSLLGHSEGVRGVIACVHGCTFSVFQNSFFSCRLIGSRGCMWCASLRRPHLHSLVGPAQSVPLLLPHRHTGLSAASLPNGNVSCGHF